jgi:hypothetical protein
MNSLLVIKPYWWEGTWVFDDPDVGLTRGPFVAGIPEMIDLLVRDIPDARRGCSSPRNLSQAIKLNSSENGPASLAATGTAPRHLGRRWKGGSAPPSSNISTKRRR